MNTHAATTLVCPFTWEAVEIDRPLVPIIRKLWVAKVRTRFSCQGGEPYVGEDMAAEVIKVYDAEGNRIHPAYISFDRADLLLLLTAIGEIPLWMALDPLWPDDERAVIRFPATKIPDLETLLEKRRV